MNLLKISSSEPLGKFQQTWHKASFSEKNTNRYVLPQVQIIVNSKNTFMN